MLVKKVSGPMGFLKEVNGVVFSPNYLARDLRQSRDLSINDWVFFHENFSVSKPSRN